MYQLDILYILFEHIIFFHGAVSVFKGISYRSVYAITSYRTSAFG